MKISETRSGHKLTKGKKTHRSEAADSEAFLKELSASSVTENQNVSAPVTINQMDALFSIQEIPDAMQEKEEKACLHGEYQLDQLDQLRHKLLLRELELADLEKIQSDMAELDVTSLPDNLQEILTEIDLRVQVEIAKYQRQFR